MGSYWKTVYICFVLDMDDMGGGTENTSAEFAGDSEDREGRASRHCRNQDLNS